VRRPVETARTIRYEVRWGGARHAVEIQPLEGNTYRVYIDGRALVLDARQVGVGVYSVLAGPEVHEVDVEPLSAEDAVRVQIGGRAFDVEILDERKRRMQLARAGGAVAGEGSVHAPMPGKVVKVLVQAGDKVRAGQGIVVVEAMKMENELRAPSDGTVREVRVSVGQTVEIRETLVVVE
jgi:biotin carboxyl carrier protein